MGLRLNLLRSLGAMAFLRVSCYQFPTLSQGLPSLDSIFIPPVKGIRLISGGVGREWGKAESNVLPSFEIDVTEPFPRESLRARKISRLGRGITNRRNGQAESTNRDPLGKRKEFESRGISRGRGKQAKLAPDRRGKSLVTEVDYRTGVGKNLAKGSISDSSPTVN
ncbi:UNVERIFIED_CONTAM: putative mitochondrial protein [Sesamum calycinum]|uniref:Mitochondrial protein n=1 Tax=Sesamum calycinum TaxID=2727403 RepID=A0AAW2K0F9_9LAMI